MTAHDRFLLLAAEAIDFPLSARQTALLAGHFAGCAECARRAARLQDDAQRIARLPARLPPPRSADVLRATINRQAPLTLRPALLAALLLLLIAALAGGLIGAAAILRTLEDRGLSIVEPSPTFATSQVPPSPAPASPTPSSAEPTAAASAPPSAPVTGWLPMVELEAGNLRLVVDEATSGSTWLRGGSIATWQGRFFAALEGGGILASADGSTWDRVPDVEATQVVAGSSRLLAWRGTTIWSSEDGATWREHASAPAFAADEPAVAAIGAVASWQGGFVAVGSVSQQNCADGVCLPGPVTGAAWRSATGDDWDRVDLGEDLGPAGDFGGWGLHDVVAGPNRLVVLGVADEGTRWQAWLSGDGLSWQRAPEFPESDLYVERLGGGERLFALTYSDGPAPAALWELTGGAWIDRAGGALRGQAGPVTVHELIQTPGGYVAVGSAGGVAAAWASGDGFEWGRVELDEFVGVMTGIAASGDRIVIGGAVGSTVGETRQAFWLAPPGSAP